MCRVTLGFGRWGRRKTPPLLAPQAKPFPLCGSLSCPLPPSHHSTPPGSDVCGETPRNRLVSWLKFSCRHQRQLPHAPPRGIRPKVNTMCRPGI